MDAIKEAFLKVKQDIDFLKQEHSFLFQEFLKIQQNLVKINKKLDFLMLKTFKLSQTHSLKNKTLSTHSSTHSTGFNGLKTQNLGFSTGNQGVSTDRQTDRQTDISTQNSLKRGISSKNLTSYSTLDNAEAILASLDSLKKEIRLKFKRLTEQELLVFSTIYQLDEEQGYADHKILSKKLHLSESSIRDYIGRLIKKGIPIEKKRINNKTIQLSISQNLKKIASLSTILKLREI